MISNQKLIELESIASTMENAGLSKDFVIKGYSLAEKYPEIYDLFVQAAAETDMFEKKSIMFDIQNYINNESL